MFCSDLAGWEEAGPGVALLPLRYDGPGRGQTTLNHLAELLVPATKISYVTYIIKNSKQKERDALNIQIFFFFFRLNQFPSGCRISEKAGKGAEHATGFFKAKQRKFLLFCTSNVNLKLDIWYVYAYTVH